MQTRERVCEVYFCFILTFLLQKKKSSSGENQDSDMKLFMKAVQDQFKLLNMRLDSLESPSSRSKPNRKHTVEEEEDEDLEYDETSSRKGKEAVPKRDGNLGSIKMTIPAFQGKNDPELYWSGREKLSMFLIVITIQMRRR